MKVSVVIPTFGKPNLLENCLYTLRKYHDINFEIVVHDDGSDEADSIAEVAKKYGAKFYRSETNKGYGANVNSGISCTCGEYVFVVNSDIKFTENLLGPMLEAMKKDDKIAVCGCRLMYPDGRIQHAGIFKSNEDFGHFSHGHDAEKSPTAFVNKYLLCVTGAIHGVNRKYWDGNKYPEKFFVANEDTKYCVDAWNNGWRVFYVGTNSAIHLEGGTRGATIEEKMAKNEKWTLLEEIGLSLWQQELEKYDWNELYSRQFNANREMGNTDNSIVIERTAALGDVIYTTGCIYEMKRRYPDLNVFVKTLIPGVFQNNPDVVDAHYAALSMSGRICSLDDAYEKRPDMGIIEAYAEVMGLDKEKCKPVMYCDAADEMSLMCKFDYKREKYIVVHPGFGWKNKTLPRLTWEMIVYELAKVFKVVVVGRAADHRIRCKNNVIDLFGVLNIQEMYVLIKNARYFVGNDSGILAVCQCTDTPGSAIFTCAKPEHIICKDTIQAIVPPGLECLGCLKRQKPPVHYCECPENKDYECIRRLTYKFILGEIDKKLGK